MKPTPSSSAPAPLRIRMLGPLDVRVQGEPLPPLRSRKGYWLLALLVLRAGREVRREWLAETLWPDSFGEEAFASLRQSLRDLRLRLGAEAGRIEAPTTRTLRFEPAGAEIDLITFDAALRRGDSPDLQAAVSLYSGPLLEGCAELWVLPEREGREHGYLQAVEQLAREALSTGDATSAARILESAVRMAPLRQTLHRTLMEALAALGEFQRAAEVYQELRRRLHHDFNAQPDPDTTRLYHEIRETGKERAAHAGARSAAGFNARPPSGSAANPDPTGLVAHRLPEPLTPLIGRDADLLRLTSLLSPGAETGVRLLTLSGPGGVGKTRLALAVAHRLQARFADRACFVDLSGVRQAAQLGPAFAVALGVREESSVPLFLTVTQALQHRELLLVLDNCEQIVREAAREAAALLRRCPRLAILTTSRERLGITGETVHPVAPLPISALSGTGAPGSVPAAELFLQRVAAVVPGFMPGEVELEAVGEICRKLDGLPLALELAAPLAELLPLPELARHLDRRFELLSHGDPTAPERHQSLQALADWSYELLSSDEQHLFRCLSVFTGSWTLAAAEAVAEAPVPLAPRVQRLVAKSLVTPEAGSHPSGERRFRLLETLREYAAARLEEAGEGEAVRGRHLEFATHQAEAATAGLTGPEQLAWLACLDADYDHLHAALCWSIRRTAADASASLPSSALRLSAALGRYWQIRGLFSEGYHLLTAALALSAGTDAPTLPAPAAAPPPATLPALPAERAHALGWAGFLATYLGNYPAALEHGEASLALWRALEERGGIAAALGTLGITAKDCGDRERAENLFTESLALYRAEGDRVGEASILGYLGIIAAGRQDPDTARKYYEESLRIRQDLQDRWGIAASLNNLGLLARHSGDLSGARRLLEESLEHRRALGDRRCTAITLNQLGLIHLEARDFAPARTCFRESLELSRNTGDRRSIAYSLEAIARLLSAEDEPAPDALANAVRLCAAAAKLRRILPAPLTPAEAGDQNRRHQELRARLGEAEFDHAWQAGGLLTGKLLTLEAAVSLALSA